MSDIIDVNPAKAERAERRRDTALTNQHDKRIASIQAAISGKERREIEDREKLGEMPVPNSSGRRHKHVGLKAAAFAVAAFELNAAAADMNVDFGGPSPFGARSREIPLNAVSGEIAPRVTERSLRAQFEKTKAVQIEQAWADHGARNAPVDVLANEFWPNLDKCLDNGYVLTQYKNRMTDLELAADEIAEQPLFMTLVKG